VLHRTGRLLLLFLQSSRLQRLACDRCGPQAGSVGVDAMKLIKTARILTLSAMLPFAAFAATSAIAEDEGSAAKGAATGAAVGAATGMRAGKGAAAGAIIGRTKSDEPSAGKGAATGAAFGAATGRGAAKGAATGAIIGGAKKNNDGSKEHLTEVLINC
jgi:hypothetical protein